MAVTIKSSSQSFPEVSTSMREAMEQALAQNRVQDVQDVVIKTTADTAEATVVTDKPTEASASLGKTKNSTSSAGGFTKAILDAEEKAIADLKRTKVTKVHIPILQVTPPCTFESAVRCLFEAEPVPA